ncbi:hypothetical protein ACFFL1_05995 [Samsonia erythrinae]|uniref:Uncharacterized protein n=1 Tax=Samsonia erythrinae TaxID=160434 RepID=A0A4R3VJ75_9GAMM|nr:hypothetical protein [Samsonia erythrinae]TCV04183.1 hypothetical protein EDC54_11153 [Samsonia erythrinae]
MSKQTGGPAFPYSGVHKGDNENYIIDNHGMTLRDYFAREALGLCFAQYLNHAEVEGFSEGWREGVASDAYLMADAMLKAREG